MRFLILGLVIFILVNSMHKSNVINKYKTMNKEINKYMIGSCRGGYEQGYTKALEKHGISSDLGPSDLEVDDNCKDSTIENFLEFD